jgi:hypothetical protein
MDNYSSYIWLYLQQLCIPDELFCIHHCLQCLGQILKCKKQIKIRLCPLSNDVVLRISTDYVNKGSTFLKSNVRDWLILDLDSTFRFAEIPGSIFTKARSYERRRKSKLCIRLHVGWHSLVVQIHQTWVYIFMCYALVPFVQA